MFKLLSLVLLISVSQCVLSMPSVKETTKISAEDKFNRSYSIVAGKYDINLTLKNGQLNMNHNNNVNLNSAILTTTKKTQNVCDGCLYFGPGATVTIYLETFSGCICIAPGGTLIIYF